MLTRGTNEIIDDMIQTIKTMKHVLVKTVIVTDAELENLFKEQNEKINKIIYDLENNMDKEISSAFKAFNDIINPEIKEDEETSDPKAKDKKAAAKKVENKILACRISPKVVCKFVFKNPFSILCLSIAFSSKFFL